MKNVSKSLKICEQKIITKNVLLNLISKYSHATLSNPHDTLSIPLGPDDSMDVDFVYDLVDVADTYYVLSDKDLEEVTDWIQDVWVVGSSLVELSHDKLVAINRLFVSKLVHCVCNDLLMGCIFHHQLILHGKLDDLIDFRMDRPGSIFIELSFFFKILYVFLLDSFCALIVFHLEQQFLPFEVDLMQDDLFEMLCLEFFLLGVVRPLLCIFDASVITQENLD